MSEAGEFVDAALQNEGSWSRARDEQARLGGGLRFYGASIGAVRGTIRDAARRHPGAGHDEITALSTELWSVPVYERRLAAVVLLQSNLRMLDNSDLTRIEGFVRGAGMRELVDPLAIDVIGPMVETLEARNRERADAALDRWSRDDDPWLRRAALLSPLRALRSGGDQDAFLHRARTTLVAPAGFELAEEAIAIVLEEISGRG